MFDHLRKGLMVLCGLYVALAFVTLLAWVFQDGYIAIFQALVALGTLTALSYWAVWAVIVTMDRHRSRRPVTRRSKERSSWWRKWQKRSLPKKLEKSYERLAKEIEAIKQIRTASEIVKSWSSPYGASGWASEILSVSEVHKWLALKRRSPLKVWMSEWIPTEKRRFRHVILDSDLSWRPHMSLRIAKKQQHVEYSLRLKEHLAKARILQERVNQLSSKLCIEPEDLLAEAGFPTEEVKLAEPVKVRVSVEETAREELSRLRAELAQNDLDFRDPRFTRIAEIEEALLAEQPNDGPLREQAGIPSDN